MQLIGLHGELGVVSSEHVVGVALMLQGGKGRVSCSGAHQRRPAHRGRVDIGAGIRFQARDRGSYRVRGTGSGSGRGRGRERGRGTGRGTGRGSGRGTGRVIVTGEGRLWHRASEHG